MPSPRVSSLFARTRLAAGALGSDGEKMRARAMTRRTPERRTTVVRLREHSGGVACWHWYFAPEFAGSRGISVKLSFVAKRCKRPWSVKSSRRCDPVMWTVAWWNNVAPGCLIRGLVPPSSTVVCVTRCVLPYGGAQCTGILPTQGRVPGTCDGSALQDEIADTATDTEETHIWVVLYTTPQQSTPPGRFGRPHRNDMGHASSPLYKQAGQVGFRHMLIPT
jgi:hypothetical protein